MTSFEEILNFYKERGTSFFLPIPEAWGALPARAKNRISLNSVQYLRRTGRISSEIRGTGRVKDKYKVCYIDLLRYCQRKFYPPLKREAMQLWDEQFQNALNRYIFSIHRAKDKWAKFFKTEKKHTYFQVESVEEFFDLKPTFLFFQGLHDFISRHRLLVRSKADLLIEGMTAAKERVNSFIKKMAVSRHFVTLTQAETASLMYERLLDASAAGENLGKSFKTHYRVLKNKCEDYRPKIEVQVQDLGVFVQPPSVDGELDDESRILLQEVMECLDDLERRVVVAVSQGYEFAEVVPLIADYISSVTGKPLSTGASVRNIYLRAMEKMKSRAAKK